MQAAAPVPAFWLSAAVILWPATCSPFFGSLGEPLVIISNSKHRALGFGIVYLLRDSASFFGAREPMLGIIDGCDGH